MISTFESANVEISCFALDVQNTFRVAEQWSAGVAKNRGKPDAGMLVRERIVTSMLKKSSGSPNWFSFLTVPGGKANKSAVLICSSAFLVRLAS